MLLALLLLSAPAHAGTLEDAINSKVTPSTKFCSATNTGTLSVACDGQDVFQGDARVSLAMKLMIEKGLKPISCNYSRAGQPNSMDAIFCALSRP